MILLRVLRTRLSKISRYSLILHKSDGGNVGPAVFWPVVKVLGFISSPNLVACTAAAPPPHTTIASGSGGHAPNTTPQPKHEYDPWPPGCGPQLRLSLQKVNRLVVKPASCFFNSQLPNRATWWARHAFACRESDPQGRSTGSAPKVKGDSTLICAERETANICIGQSRNSFFFLSAKACHSLRFCLCMEYVCSLEPVVTVQCPAALQRTGYNARLGC